MQQATERQKEKLKELDIDFDEDITKEEAAKLLRPHAKEHKIQLNLKEDSLVEFSEIKLSEI